MTLSKRTSGTTLRRLPDGYDLDHLRGALEYLTQFRVAVDGGAHRGIWTAEMVTRFESVVAFEPRREYADAITDALVFDVVLGAEMGRCAIVEGDKNDGQAHVADGATHTIRPLDWYGLADVDFLKLDLEGYELNALHGAKETIEGSRPAILVEQNGLCARYGYTVDDLERWLVAAGYTETAAFGVDHLWLPNARRRRLQH